MQPLGLDVLPLRPAVRNDGPVTLDVLIRITPPTPGVAPRRPPINLGLVLDRSGSMAAAKKLEYAREAAIFAVGQLLPTDRVSVTIFDDEVETIVPSTPVTDKPGIVRRLQAVHPGGSTALFAAWSRGAGQVREFLQPQGLNRVLLLTDGLANVGETSTDAICSAVHAAAKTGVSTTTLGVGKDYNEDLLEAMARSGDGNYVYIETPKMLADVFQSELQGLMATVGQRTLLGIEPLNGVTLVEVLNDLERDPEGRVVLPNLVVGLPVELVLRFAIPAQQSGKADLCGFRLTWIDPQQGEQFRTFTLTLPAVSEAEWLALEENARTREMASLQLIARHKKAAALHVQRGDHEAGAKTLQQCRDLLNALEQTETVQQEAMDLSQIEELLRQGDMIGTAKAAKFQNYRRGHSK